MAINLAQFGTNLAQFITFKTFGIKDKLNEFICK